MAFLMADLGVLMDKESGKQMSRDVRQVVLVVSGFCEGKIVENLEKRTLEQKWDPGTNSTKIWRQINESNPGHSSEVECSYRCVIPTPKDLCLNVITNCYQSRVLFNFCSSSPYHDDHPGFWSCREWGNNHYARLLHWGHPNSSNNMDQGWW